MIFIRLQFNLFVGAGLKPTPTTNKKNNNMTHHLDAVAGHSKDEIQISATGNIGDNLDSYTPRRIAEELLKESGCYGVDAQKKREQAHEYLHAADGLEKLARAVRLKARQLRSGKITEEEALNAVKNIIEQSKLQILLPKNITPRELLQIAHQLEQKAKEFRIKAQNLIKDAHQDEHFSRQLKQQAEKILTRESHHSGLSLMSILSRNEGLKFVLEKLGVLKLDAQYKQQIEYSERKSLDEGARLGYTT